MDDYDELERVQTRTRQAVDHTRTWNRLEPASDINGGIEQQLQAFADAKHISLDAIAALGARIRVEKSGRVELAYAGTNHAGQVTAIKYRPLNGSSHESHAATPSVWLRPNIIGKTDSLDWIIAEGETDAARLWDLVGHTAAIMVLPAGARTFKRAWADLIPRGATVALCHDADPDGDEGAYRAKNLIGGKTIRIRPPVEGGDWCDWDGTTHDFLLLFQQLAETLRSSIDFTPIQEFADIDEPAAEPLATDHEGGAAIPADAFILIYGDGGAGKTTLSIDLACHLAAGKPWLDLINPVRPLRIALVENEGPRAMFRRKLRAKLEHGWELHSDEIVVLNEPWQAIDLREAAHRTELVDALSNHRTDLLIAGPLSRLGMQGGGTLDEIGVFSAYLTDIQHRMENPLTILLIHHENRAGRISGAWEGIPDTLIHIQAQGHGSTRVYWQKLRWGSHLHGKSTNLKWAPGETFTIDDEPMLDDNDLGDLIINAVRDNPGAGWNEILQAMKDANPDGLTRPERLKVIRDRLLKARKLANEGTANRFKLYTAAEHPIIPRFPDSQAGIDSGIADSPSPVAELTRVTDSPIPDYRRESVTRESPPATFDDPDDDIPF